jgi:hypothetical protein
MEPEPIKLAYANPGLMPSPLASVPDDHGPFLVLGSAFFVPGGFWHGPAVASPLGIYLVKLHCDGRGYFEFRTFGGFLEQALAPRPDDVRTCAIQDLPSNLRRTLDPKNNLLTADVIVLPRQAIRRLEAGWFNNTVNVHLGEEVFLIRRSIFARSTIRKFLAENGWILDREISPTAEPIHGENLGRTLEEVLQSRRSARMIAILIAMYMALLLIVFLAFRRQFGVRW